MTSSKSRKSPEIQGTRTSHIKRPLCFSSRERGRICTADDLPVTFRTGEKNKNKELRNDVFFSRKAARILGTDSAESFSSRREQVRLWRRKE